MRTAQQQITQQMQEGNITITECLFLKNWEKWKKYTETQNGFTDLSAMGCTIMDWAIKTCGGIKYPNPQNERQEQKNQETTEKAQELAKKFDTTKFKSFKVLHKWIKNGTSMQIDEILVDGIC